MGLSLALMFAACGKHTLIQDINEASLDVIGSGVMPHMEHGAEDYYPRLGIREPRSYDGRQSACRYEGYHHHNPHSGRRIPKSRGERGLIPSIKEPSGLLIDLIDR